MSPDKHEAIAQLRTLALLHHLPDAKLEELLRFLVVQAVAAGDVIFEEGSLGDTMFLLAAGQVSIEKDIEAGGSVELALLGAGDVFGEMALIERRPRSARAVARADTTLFVLGRQDLQHWLEADPLVAVGLFVELLRVLSNRLRRSSRSVALLNDVGDLTAQRAEDEESLLRAVLHRMLPHLEGDWSAAGYVYNEFNNEVVRVATEGPRGPQLPATIPIVETKSRWLDAASFCVVLTQKTGTPLGFLVAQNDRTMGVPERADAEIALTTVGHLVSSALQNIKHDTEERLRARLQQRQAHDFPR
jgi:CRP-like cAMP-binding protein